MITVADVNQFLTDNISITTLDATLKSSVEETVLSKLRSVYDVSGWSNTINTPKLVLSIMGMLYAGRFYSKEHSGQDTNASSYGMWLINQAELLLMQLVSGKLALSEDFPVLTNNRDLINESIPAFTMGDVF